ncbi:MAG TPA: phospho-N-acetylmuramoyl-pentapeptide-transferase [bacterium]|nr:phospho-N-acetylmuramoyl-pentapeptide-transferase [bacterium]
MDLIPLVAAWSFAAVLVLAAGAPVVEALQRAGVGQTVREDAPSRHAAKAGTPTMGGLLIIGAALAAALGVAVVLGRPPRALAVALGVIAIFAAIGALDDRLGITRGRNLGLRAREKFALQIPVALALGVYVALTPGLGTVVDIPGTAWRVDLGWGYPLFCAVLVVGMANAVNLTDGLDGLAAGGTAIAAGALAVLAAFSGALPSGIVAAAVGGASLGFLWYNAHPAQVFMGDVGSLGLGAALAVAGILAKLEVLMLILGGLFVAEALSVMLQVAWFKLTGGRRLFRMSPLHHHFELAGWSETQTVVRFWVCGALLAAVGVRLGL